MTVSTLLVRREKRLVGTLYRSVAGMSFVYDRGWLEAEDRFAISLSLPLDGSFDDARATRFFANLLPEAGVRTLVARRLGISEGNDFALLAAIGGECAGALSVVPEGADHEDGDAEYEVLPRKKLAELASSYEALPRIDGAGRARLSLAGAQDKLPVKLVDGDRILLPLAGSPSTHILKFANRSYKHLPANEAIVMELARRVGLRAPATRFRDIGDEGFCIVERYDRELVDGGEVRRLHQEDFCQAMGLPASAKYEDEGGPSFADVVELVREHSIDPLRDVDALVRWLAFNAIVGNADGHAKNLSFVLRDGLRLAPFYDLVCTRSYEGLERRLAMRVGSERDPDRLRLVHLEECARALDLKLRLFRDTFAATAERVLDAFDDAIAAAEVGESPAVQRVRPVVRKQARRWLREVASTRR